MQITVSLHAARVVERGETKGLIVHVLDTTQQRHLELQFAQAQKMQAVGQLAGGIAYDFNNLLTAMLGFCDLLLARHGPSDPSFDDIVQIRQNAIRASNLVRQLLAFSRKQALKPVPHDVNQALAQLSAMLGRLLGPRVELHLERADHLGRIRVDPGQFDRVIINLAVNARDAMPEGGVLMIQTLPAVVREPVHRGAEVMPPGRYALIQASDTGIGMAKEIIGNIFEPFFSTKEVGAGTGLGLSTVYGIVRQTGGFIFVDSAPGEGATFSVYLPSEPEDAGGAEAAAKEATPALNNDWTGAGTVLLVEDEEAVRVLAARALRNHGYRVLEATDGETALELMGARNTAVDLIVTDMVMPGMDGPTLVRRIRQELGSVKVILMSGYMEERMDAADGEAPIHFLQKPFTLGELAGKVKDVLAR